MRASTILLTIFGLLSVILFGLCIYEGRDSIFSTVRDWFGSSTNGVAEVNSTDNVSSPRRPPLVEMESVFGPGSTRFRTNGEGINRRINNTTDAPLQPKFNVPGIGFKHESRETQPRQDIPTFSYEQNDGVYQNNETSDNKTSEDGRSILDHLPTKKPSIKNTTLQLDDRTTLVIPIERRDIPSNTPDTNSTRRLSDVDDDYDYEAEKGEEDDEDYEADEDEEGDEDYEADEDEEGDEEYGDYDYTPSGEYSEDYYQDYYEDEEGTFLDYFS